MRLPFESRASVAIAHRRPRRAPATAALLSGLVFLGGVAIAASPVRAQTVPAATSSTLCAVSGSPNVVDPMSCLTSNDQAQVVFAPAPTVSVAADYPGNLALVSAGARAQLTYSFAVLGGSAGDLVHLDIATLLHWATEGSINAYAFSRVIVTTNLGVATANICTFGCGAGDGVTDFNGTLHVDASSGAINTVAMDVAADAAFSHDANDSRAFADPVLSIDPSTPNAGAYWLVLSDGIGNSAPAVPEPANWALMLSGIAALGLTFGGRRQVSIA